MLSRLIRHRTVGAEGEISRATWMEPFYDLVFVVAVAQLGNRLGTEHSFAGVLEFVALFSPVWWAWVGQKRCLRQ
jgi:low temperature requirement protein LtrA